MPAHVEIERKFDVDESTMSPSFDGITAVTRRERSPSQSLDAVYFDTSSHDLAANAVTLRRRTGGPDAGWHLKLPAGPDTRTEVRAPLRDTDQVPDELLDVVLAIVRDRPLEPVARITTTRTVELLHDADGGVLAEFCDDRVIAWAGDDDPGEQRWREWELEVGHADAGLLEQLSTRLLDAGATPSGHGSKLARVLGSGSAPDDAARARDPIHRAIAKQVARLVVTDRAVRADADDAVHQMRVATRKLRSLLETAGETVGPDQDAWILDELRELASVLGVARDAEVLAQRYRRALDQLPAELVRGPVRERLVGGAARRYQAGRRRALAAMRSPRYFRLLDGLDALVAGAPPADGGAAPATLDTAYRRVRKAGKAAKRARGADRDAALHRIRKAAKRLRYTAVATNAGKVAKRAKVIQTLLGDHQDSVVSRTHLLQQADAALAAGEDTFTYGLLYLQESDLARACRAQLGRALRKLDKALRKRTR